MGQALGGSGATIRSLLIDNFDSYSYNVFQLLAEINGEPPTVIYNDSLDWRSLREQIEVGRFHNIVISPGPGTPARPGDIGVCMPLLQAQLGIPILGICLGFQALALAHDGRVVHAPEPVHGRLSAVAHSGHPLFRDVPSGLAYQVVRYHSLLVDWPSLPACFDPLAWTTGRHHALNLAPEQAQQEPSLAAGAGLQAPCPSGERLLMAIAHRSLPHYGVQFHPESVATGFGPALLRNFRDITAQFWGLPAQPPVASLAGPPGRCLPPAEWAVPGKCGSGGSSSTPGPSLAVHYQHLPGVLAAAGSSERLFWELFGGGGAEDTFWLDSATPDRGRFSFMGGPGGPLWRRITYKLPSLAGTAAAGVDSGGVANGVQNGSACSTHRPLLQPGTVTETDAKGRQVSTACTLWAYLEQSLQRWQCRVGAAEAADLPFDFWGGLVGYLGYELKAECGGSRAHESPLPDACLLLADRLLAVDHHKGDVYLLALYELGSDNSGGGYSSGSRGGSSGSSGAGGHGSGGATLALAEAWVAELAQRVLALAAGPDQEEQQRRQQQVQQVPKPLNGALAQPPPPQQQWGSQPPPFRLREGRQRYLDNVRACMQALHDGESYEVCLTTMLQRDGAPDPRRLYTALRAINPAPYATWLCFGGGGPQVCCSSPERFLRMGRGGVLEAKPIKGTARRHKDPAADAAAAAELAASEKDRAENLMIVDLLRNDLGRVCEAGSVHVPGLMEIESYATVHQMVSTVRGQRRRGCSAIDCIRAAFPGGSMTGAPKIRTMEILDRLEGGPRGIYSGSIGFIGFNDTFDLNIVIRTAVLHGGQMTIGAGGAIVVQSDPQGEYDEMRLKAAALLRAVGLCDTGGDGGPAAVDES